MIGFGFRFLVSGFILVVIRATVAGLEFNNAFAREDNCVSYTISEKGLFAWTNAMHCDVLCPQVAVCYTL